MNRVVWSGLMVAILFLVGSGECPSGDCPPEDGLLKAGSWGGDHWRFEVGSDGTVFVETDCARGTSTSPVHVTGGSVDFTAEMVRTDEAVQYPDSDPVQFVASFEGTVCHDTLHFTETVDGSLEDPEALVTTDGLVVYGEPATLWTCDQ